MQPRRSATKSPRVGNIRQLGNTAPIRKPNRNRVGGHTVKKPGRGAALKPQRNRPSVGGINRLASSKIGKSIRLNDQVRMRRRGDVTRRLDMHNRLARQGGWRQREHHGHISENFLHSHFGSHYFGPRYYPSHCWTPHWCDWVDWSWHNVCDPIFDPRPILCRPVYYDHCPRWTYCDYPVWQRLPIVVCGTWIDVPAPIVVGPSLDLELLAVRFVDAGHSEQNLGPRYRVWLRNNSKVDINTPFNVLMLAGNDKKLAVDLPQVGLRMNGLDAGAVESVDLRLPVEATQLADEEAAAGLVTFLSVIIDSHRELDEAFEENNGTTLSAADVLPVDPALFSVDERDAAVGQTISLSGEGLGPEPGKVIVSVASLELEAVIEGWYDLGIRITLPQIPLASVTDAELLVIRGDGVVSNSLPISLIPRGVAAIPVATP